MSLCLLFYFCGTNHSSDQIYRYRKTGREATPLREMHVCEPPAFRRFEIAHGTISTGFYEHQDEVSVFFLLITYKMTAKGSSGNMD